jgi:hypothetical protein
VSAEDSTFISLWLNISHSNIDVYKEEVLSYNPVSYRLDNTADEQYKAIIISANESVLEKLNLTKSFIRYSDPGGASFVDSVQKRLVFYYYPTIFKLKIFDNRKLLLEYDLSDYNLCNLDKVCNPLNENEEVCPQDCSITEFSKSLPKLKVEEEDIEVEKKEAKKEPSVKQKDANNLIILIIILAIVLVAIFILIIRKKK